MGKEARRHAQEKMLRGEIPIRIGKKEKARDRRKRETESRIFMPVKKGEQPLSKLEQRETFARSRKIKEDVAAGVRAPDPVDLGEAELQEVPAEVAELIADAILRPTQRRRVHTVDRIVAGVDMGIGKDETVVTRVDESGNIVATE